MPTFTDYSLDLAHYVKIETIGVPTAGEFQQLYVFERVPDNNWTPTATQRFIDGLRLDGGFDQRADPFGGVAEVSGMSFEVQDFIEASTGVNFWGTMLATERWNADPAGFPHTYLRTQDHDRDDVALLVESTAGFPAAPSFVWVGGPGNQECVRYGVLGATSFTSCTRGRFPATGDDAVAGDRFARTHRVGLDADGSPLAPVLVTTRPQSFFGLRMVVYAVARRRDGTWEPEASAARRYTGFIRSVDFLPERNSFRFRCDGLMSALDREIFSPTRRYSSRIVGCYLGPRTEDRQFVCRDGGVSVTLTLALEWYSSPQALADAINEAIADDWQANTRPLTRKPELLLDENGHWMWHLVAGVNEYSSVDMSPGISDALGRWPYHRAWGSANGGASLDETWAAQYPEPHASLRWPVGWDDDIEIRVASNEDVRISQGDIAAGPIAIGGQYAARATATLSGGGYDQIRLRSGFGGDPFPTIDHARGISIIVDANGESLIEEGNYREQGNATVEQVFVPLVASVANVVRRILLSTGTAGYNNATYDVLAEGYGIGVDDDDVDLTSFTSVFVPGLAEWEVLRYMWRQPQPAREWLDEVGKLVGASFVMRSGQITLRRATPFALARNVVATITDNDLLEEDTKPGYSVTPSLFLTCAELRWGWDPFAEEFTRGPLLVRISEALSAAENRPVKVESRGLYGANLAQVAEDAEALLAWLAVFRRPQARVRFRLSARWVNRIVPGEPVAVTVSALHNRRTGGYGTTAIIGIVLSVHETWHEGVEADVLLLDEQRQAPLAPSALLDYSRGDGGWDAANNRLYLRDNEFTDAPDLDINWFLAGDQILVCQDNPADPTAPLLWRVDVLSVTNGGAGSRYLTLTGALPPPAFDANQTYFVTFDTYDVTATGRRDDGTWIADDADSRIGATTDWYPYA